MQLDKYLRDGVRYHLISSDDDNVTDIIALYFDWALRNNKKCILYKHAQNLKELEFFLEQYGYCFDALVKSGKLLIDSAYNYFVENKVYLNTEILIKTINNAIEEGFNGVAVVADRECFFESEYGEEILYQYEKKLDDIFSNNPISALSIYNLDKFGVDGFFAITHLNPNFIYKVINEIFIHNKDIVSFSYEEALGIVYTFLKRREKSVRESKIYNFISNIATEVSYKKNEGEIIETTLKYICNTSYANFGFVDMNANESEGITDLISYNVPNEIIEIYFSDNLKKKTSVNFDRLKYWLINVNELDKHYKEIFNRYNIASSVVIPIKYDDNIFGYMWLASRDTNNSLFDNAEFLYKVCETVAKIILQFKKYKKIQDSMVLTSKLQALGELTGGIAHEFNNILTPILGYVQVLREKIRDSELCNYLDMIEESAKDGAKIVKRIQDFSSKRNKAVEQVDIDKAILHSVEITKPKWAYEAQVEQKKIEMRLNLRSGSFIEGITTEVREIFVNLISNAVDAMPNGGQIEIESYNEKDVVIIRVKDNGIGMNNEVLSRIFEPFFTTKNERGNGLGLHIVYNIINSMKGNIEVNSVENKGSEFIIRFPRRARMLNDEEKIISSINQKRLNILVIDDQSQVAAVVSEMLEVLGHNTQVVNDDEKIIETFDKNNFDVVICDLAMPNITGVQISKMIKQRKKDAAFILMTGWLGKLKNDDLDCVDYIINKPFSIEELKKALNEIQKSIDEEEAVS
ncbi:Sporulation kinase A [Caloramator mitchellensis]|uniref:Stage 0 sporulation protein A homolog n=1 Tax=Caloramator mitchellensis TaxID=908809 RepID=A0A0R3JX67_CALMK|nr:ATP-binding protein [Caloramator mitchellensis]KRQ87658.1 Sporulation kinase A [Caloramator mitchellensis]